MNKGTCVFCKMARGDLKVEPIAETNNFFAISDKHPLVDGHTIIIPKAHYTTLLDIPSKLGQELVEFTKQVSLFLLEQKKGDGFNVLMNNLEPAGQIVMHAHVHVIPRKDDDGLKLN